MKYNAFNKKSDVACRAAKEKWHKNQCEEVESFERQFKTSEMHNKVEDITFRSVEKARGCTLGKNGKQLFIQRKYQPDR